MMRLVNGSKKLLKRNCFSDKSFNLNCLNFVFVLLTKTIETLTPKMRLEAPIYQNFLGGDPRKPPHEWGLAPSAFGTRPCLPRDQFLERGDGLAILCR